MLWELASPKRGRPVDKDTELISSGGRRKDIPALFRGNRMLPTQSLPKAIRMWRTFQYGIDNFVDRNAIHYLVLS